MKEAKMSKLNYRWCHCICKLSWSTLPITGAYILDSLNNTRGGCYKVKLKLIKWYWIYTGNFPKSIEPSLLSHWVLSCSSCVLRILLFEDTTSQQTTNLKVVKHIGTLQAVLWVAFEIYLFLRDHQFKASKLSWVRRHQGLPLHQASIDKALLGLKARLVGEKFRVPILSWFLFIAGSSKISSSSSSSSLSMCFPSKWVQILNSNHELWNLPMWSLPSRAGEYQGKLWFGVQVCQLF